MAAFVPLYIGDCAPSTLRGALAGAFQLSIGIGLIIGTAVDYGTRNRTDSSSYLIPMTVQAILPLFLMIACFIWLPESPRWLAEKGKVEKARRSLSRLAGSSNSDQVENDLLMITASIDQAHENTNGSWKELIIPGPESRKLMISIGMAGEWCNQTLLKFTPDVCSGISMEPSFWYQLCRQLRSCDHQLDWYRQPLRRESRSLLRSATRNHDLSIPFRTCRSAKMRHGFYGGNWPHRYC
jgi:hypothetical protein